MIYTVLMLALVATANADCTTISSCAGSTGGFNPGNCITMGEKYCCCGSDSSPPGKMCTDDDSCKAPDKSFKFDTAAFYKANASTAVAPPAARDENATTAACWYSTDTTLYQSWGDDIGAGDNDNKPVDPITNKQFYLVGQGGTLFGVSDTIKFTVMDQATGTTLDTITWNGGGPVATGYILAQGSDSYLILQHCGNSFEDCKVDMLICGNDGA